ncbi:ankyrin repeat-containing domain protein [Cladochytrium replicatum]|nr:ankyrin repeat-containing domain protein [Cladochytrium replicatum]
MDLLCRRKASRALWLNLWAQELLNSIEDQSLKTLCFLIVRRFADVVEHLLRIPCVRAKLVDVELDDGSRSLLLSALSATNDVALARSYLPMILGLSTNGMHFNTTRMDFHARSRYVFDEALNTAARLGNGELTFLFVAHGAPIFNALLSLATHNSVDIAHKILESHGPLHSSTSNQLILNESITLGHVEFTRFLLNRRRWFPDSWSARLSLQSQRWEEMLDLLVSHNASVRGESEAALLYACEHDHAQQIRKLLDLGANIHTCNNLILRHALSNCTAAYLSGNVTAHAHALRFVKRVLDLGADPDCIDGRPVLTAIETRNCEVLEYLLDAGANVGTVREWLPIRIAIGPDPALLPILELLLTRNRSGFNPNSSTVDLCGRVETPLILAITRGSIAQVTLLILHGANWDIETRSVMEAIGRRGSVDIAQAMIDIAKADLTSFENACVKAAVRAGHSVLVKFLCACLSIPESELELPPSPPLGPFSVSPPLRRTQKLKHGSPGRGMTHRLWDLPSSL